MEQSLRESITGYLDSHRHGTLATVNEGGGPYATVVSYVSSGLTVYFMTDPSSQKAKNIEYCSRVAFAVTEDYLDWDEIKAVQLVGMVEWIKDESELKQAQKMFGDKFPQVQKYLDGYGVTIDIIPFLRINPKTINFLDYSKGFNRWESLEF
jgi:nitroimidazol reductase NimA-like FMN-containing flavoprotein (pyridoxamine 5'-phosphate oxidase superfamily)